MRESIQVITTVATTGMVTLTPITISTDIQADTAEMTGEAMDFIERTTGLKIITPTLLPPTTTPL